jgi:hypothetical protein
MPASSVLQQMAETVAPSYGKIPKYEPVKNVCVKCGGRNIHSTFLSFL